MKSIIYPADYTIERINWQPDIIRIPDKYIFSANDWIQKA